jgi:hypothetical protein
MSGSHTAEYYRDAATTWRAAAEKTANLSQREKFIRLAEGYESLAKHRKPMPSGREPEGG